jgi:hypothetical protein
MRHKRVPASESSEHVGFQPTRSRGVMPMISIIKQPFTKNNSQSYRIRLRRKTPLFLFAGRTRPQRNNRFYSTAIRASP